MASGSCNDPVSSNYHLEIVLKDEEFANQVIKLTNKIKNINFNFKLIKRRNSYVVYLKKSDLISDFLAFIEANASCIKFENVRVDRDFSNVTNRLLNCDTYNYKKQFKTHHYKLTILNLLIKN